MNEVTLALLPALIPDTLLPQTPSRVLPIYPISAPVLQVGDRVAFLGEKVYPLLPLRDKAGGRERLPSRTQPCSSPAPGNQTSPPDSPTVEQKGSLGKLSGDPACGTELSPNPRHSPPICSYCLEGTEGREGTAGFSSGGGGG